jgi:hypothetical protein
MSDKQGCAGWITTIIDKGKGLEHSRKEFDSPELNVVFSGERVTHEPLSLQLKPVS